MSKLYKELQTARQRRSDLKKTTLTLAPKGEQVSVIYFESLVDESRLTLCLPQILGAWGTGTGSIAAVKLPLQVCKTLNESISSLLSGHVLLCHELRESLVALPLTSLRTDQRSDANQEAVVQGPRQAFSGTFVDDIGSVRRYLHNWNLHIFNPPNSAASVLYLADRCRPSVQRASRLALRSLNRDYPDPLPSPTVAQLISQTKGSLFPLVQQVERVDRLAEALLSGKVAIHVTGSPEMLVGPCRYIDFVRTADDDYNPSVTAPLIRWVRYVAFVTSQTLVPLWVTTKVHFPENIPRDLLLSSARLRDHLPLPAMAESLVLMVMFEVLFEVSLRLPKPIGQITGIVGGFVLGQALIAAGVLSSLMLSVVSIAFLASYAVPSVQLSRVNRIISAGLLLAGGLFGLVGITTGLIFLLAHKASVRFWGEYYGSPVSPFRLRELFTEVIWRRPQPLLRNQRGFMR